MKIRTYFVSNSSSSSFVIHKNAFENYDQYREFITRLKSIIRHYKILNSGYFGSCNTKYKEIGSFITLEVDYSSNSVFNLMEEYNLGDNINCLILD